MRNESMPDDSTIKLIPCPDCKDATKPDCKKCGGSGLVPAGK